MTERERRMYAALTEMYKRMVKLEQECRDLQSQALLAQALYTEDEVINP